MRKMAHVIVMLGVGALIFCLGGGGSCFPLSLQECSLHVHSFGGLKNDKRILFWPGAYLLVAVGSYWTELGMVWLPVSNVSLTWEVEVGWYAWNCVEYSYWYECEYVSVFYLPGFLSIYFHLVDILTLHAHAHGHPTCPWILFWIFAWYRPTCSRIRQVRHCDTMYTSWRRSF